RQLRLLQHLPLSTAAMHDRWRVVRRGVRVMDIIDHGEWISYKPDGHWLLQHNVLFCKRVSDGVDWYVYQRQTNLLTSDTVKMTLMKVEDEWTVMATQRDGSMIWPLDTRLIEVDMSGDHEKFRQKRFNFDSRTFSDARKIDMDRPLLRALAKELGGDVDRLAQSLKALLS